MPNHLTQSGFAALSWQVTGIRHDPYAQQHPGQIEEAKSPEERGKYLYPRSMANPNPSAWITRCGSGCSSQEHRVGDEGKRALERLATGDSTEDAGHLAVEAIE